MGIVGVIVLVVGIILIRRERLRLVEKLSMIQSPGKS